MSFFCVGRGRYLLQLGLAALAGAAVATVLAHTPEAQAKTEWDNPYFPFEQLGRVLAWVENEYVDPVERRRLLEGAVKGMVAELDPHSAYLPAEDYGIFQADTEGHFGGIGVEVDFGDEYITIIAPIEASPAALAGIRPGDRILAIDNQAVRGRSAPELVRMMRGEPGTKVLLTVRRKDQDQLLYFRLTRQIINVASVASKSLKGGVAYLRIKTFQTGTHAELLESIKKLREAAHGELGGIVLDMRNNPGGLVNEATAVADEFLSGGVIFTTRRRARIVDDLRADELGALRRGPVAVLVNEYSASAAELVAGALQDNRRASVVGAPTFGKGSVQTIVDLPGGAGLRLTTLRYYTPSGRPIQAQGVKPDILVGGASAALGYGVLREQNLEGHLPAVEGGRSPVTTPPEPPEDPKTEAHGGASGEDETDLGMSRDVPTDPETGVDEALKIGYRIVTGTYSKSTPKAPAPPKR
ncbi:MAG TPA: S41 family peptidase [Polyangiaceae bacterium]|nr:S41 family peptidase [Polyangiaceae bacterium]